MKLEKLERLWKVLDGKKTNIGAGLLFLALMLSSLASIWDVQALWLEHCIETLQWFGGIFSGTGLAHKGLKQREAKR